jgi:hypothetical protein
MKRRIHACHVGRRIHACHMRRRIHVWLEIAVDGWWFAGIRRGGYMHAM